ncbi:uncharacterized protein LOC134476017 isoform X2 [Cavia porcellus]|uniref:uncharacterized protein LOC134476017 isoform X2 n=1 Tax=Cavia porcellus TaxID=10141 RepID=UPI002FDFC531
MDLPVVGKLRHGALRSHRWQCQSGWVLMHPLRRTEPPPRVAEQMLVCSFLGTAGGSPFRDQDTEAAEGPDSPPAHSARGPAPRPPGPAQKSSRCPHPRAPALPGFGAEAGLRVTPPCAREQHREPPAGAWVQRERGPGSPRRAGPPCGVGRASSPPRPSRMPRPAWHGPPPSNPRRYPGTPVSLSCRAWPPGARSGAAPDSSSGLFSKDLEKKASLRSKPPHCHPSLSLRAD